MVAVEVETRATFSLGTSRVLFTNPDYALGGLHPSYDVAPGDNRFLMIRVLPREEDRRMILVLNFFEELKAKVGN